MLTVRQLLVVSGQNSGDILNTNALRAEFPVRPLSLRSVITAYEKQRVVMFVSLISIKVFLSPNIRSIPDLVQASNSVEGQMDGAEILAFSSKLRERGLSLRLLNKSQRRFAIIGLVPSLVNTPTVVVNDRNLLQIRDVVSGARDIAGGVIGLGTALATVSAVPEPASPFLFLGGLGLLAAGSGALFGLGLYETLTNDSPSQAKPTSPESSLTPNEVGPDGEAEGEIELPNAVSLGSAPSDLNIDGVLQQLGDFAVDFSVDTVLSDLPVGFDAGTGEGLPGIPSGDGEDSGDGGGFNPFG